MLKEEKTLKKNSQRQFKMLKQRKKELWKPEAVL